MSEHFVDYDLFDIHSEHVKRLLDIFFESYSDVNMSKNIETVDSRFGLMMSAAEKLKVIGVDFAEFWRLYSLLDIEILFNKAADRFIIKQRQEISKLKSVAGKHKRWDKAENIVANLANMPQVCKDFAIFKIRQERGK